MTKREKLLEMIREVNFIGDKSDEWIDGFETGLLKTLEILDDRKSFDD